MTRLAELRAAKRAFLAAERATGRDDEPCGECRGRGYWVDEQYREVTCCDCEGSGSMPVAFEFTRETHTGLIHMGEAA